MLTKNSIATLVLLSASVQASVQAQAPLWFDTSAPLSESSTQGPVQARAAAEAWSGAAANRKPFSQLPSKPLPSKPLDQPLWLSQTPWSNDLNDQARLAPTATSNWIESNRFVIPTNQTSPATGKTQAAHARSGSSEINSTAKLAPGEKPTASLLPWSSLTEISKDVSRPKPVAVTASQSADAFIKRAELQLQLQSTQTPAEQPLAPKQEPANPGSIAKPRPGATTLGVTPMKIAAPSSDRDISTKLSSRALQNGEVEGGLPWQTLDMQQSLASGISKTQATQVKAAAEESLIPGDATTLAFWQDQGLNTERTDADDGTVKKQIDSPSDTVNASSRNKEKFSTATMVGPMTHAGQLFSMLEVQDRFQAYAEPVLSNRTRDLDSPSQAPYTLECYSFISPVFYHKPLYFEQPNLERYGQGTYRCLQPAASSIHFFGTIPLLPYKMLTQNPCEKHYTLGNQRPGNCNAVQKRVITGQSYLGEVREYWRPGSGY